MTSIVSVISNAETTLTSTVSGLSTLGKQISNFSTAIQAAVKAKFGDVSLDAVAAVDAAEIITQVLADFGVPGAAQALTIEQIIAALAPDAIPAFQFIFSCAKPAQPGLSPENGGYPAGASDARSRG